MTDPQDTPLNSLVGRLAQVVGSLAQAVENDFAKLEIEPARATSEGNDEETETD